MVAGALFVTGTASATVTVKSDHEAHHVDTIAIGFAGTNTVPSTMADPGAVVIDGDGSATLTVRAEEIVVPRFGARYWVNETLGFDVSFGISYDAGDEARDVRPARGSRSQRASTHAPPLPAPALVTPSPPTPNSGLSPHDHTVPTHVRRELGALILPTLRGLGVGAACNERD